MFAASIHCSYYSCFQLSKYALKTCGVNYDEQQSNSKGPDSHFFVKNETSKKIETKSHLDHLDYNKFMERLKKARRTADYTCTGISLEDAQTSYKEAKQVNIILNKNFIL